MLTIYFIINAIIFTGGSINMIRQKYKTFADNAVIFLFMTLALSSIYFLFK